MIEAFLPKTPEWAIPILDILTFIVGSLGALRITVTGKIIGLSGKLDNHIKADEIYHTQMLEKIEETITETKKNTLRLKPFSENELFFKDIINIGFLGANDIEKFIYSQYDENSITDKEKIEIELTKVNEYIKNVIDLLTSFCREIMTVGIEDIDERLLTRNASNSIQKSTKLFNYLWGQKHTVEYVRTGSKDREIFIKQVLEISNDIANNKLERFRSKAKDYAHEMIAGFSRYYYSNMLHNYKE